METLYRFCLLKRLLRLFLALQNMGAVSKRISSRLSLFGATVTSDIGMKFCRTKYYPTKSTFKTQEEVP